MSYVPVRIGGKQSLERRAFLAEFLAHRRRWPPSLHRRKPLGSIERRLTDKQWLTLVLAAARPLRREHGNRNFCIIFIMGSSISRVRADHVMALVDRGLLAYDPEDNSWSTTAKGLDLCKRG